MPHASCFMTGSTRRTAGRRVVVVMAAMVLGAVLIAQEQPTFRAGTTLVEVSAIVTRDGAPVTDLRRDEVRLLDNGVEQPLVAFEYVDLTKVEGPAKRRDFVLVIDDWHIDPRLTKPTQDVALRFVDALGAHDRLAIVSTGPHDLVQQLSTDRDESRRLIRRVRGQKGFAGPWEIEMRARTALQVLQSVAETLTSDAAERRAVVVISQGHALFAENRSTLSADAELVRAAYHDVLREASLANVAIYGIDPRGLVVGGPTNVSRMVGGAPMAAEAAARVGAGVADSMAARYYGSLGLLAVNTGGTLTVDTNDLGKRIPGIMQDSRQYYRLAYAQPELTGKAQSEPRRIEVQVDRTRVEVRARQRYVPR